MLRERVFFIFIHSSSANELECMNNCQIVLIIIIKLAMLLHRHDINQCYDFYCSKIYFN